MKISIIIPCFNAGCLLKDQLDALSNQTLSTIQPSEWEIIVVDNRSHDNSIEIAQTYLSKIPNLRIIEATERQGVAHARNVGARAAMGKFLAFCDADDIVSKTWVESILSALSNHPFVASCFDYKFLNGFAEGNQSYHLQTIRPRFFEHAGGCGMGIHASIFSEVGGFDEEIMFLEDMEFSFKVQASGYPLFFEKQAIIYVRQRSTASGGFRQARKWAEVFPLICKRYQKVGLEKMSLLMMMKAYCGTLMRLIHGLWSGNLRPCLWELGWRCGYLIGCFRYRSMPFVEPN